MGSGGRDAVGHSPRRTRLPLIDRTAAILGATLGDEDARDEWRLNGWSPAVLEMGETLDRIDLAAGNDFWGSLWQM